MSLWRLEETDAVRGRTADQIVLDLLTDGEPAKTFEGGSGLVLLGDEICPDTCRFWDAKTGKKLDKDRFRQDLGEVEEAYQEVHRRICAV